MRNVGQWSVTRLYLGNYETGNPPDRKTEELVCAYHAQTAIRGVEDWVDSMGYAPCVITLTLVIGEMNVPCDVCSKLDKFKNMMLGIV